MHVACLWVHVRGVGKGGAKGTCCSTPSFVDLDINDTV